MQWENYYWVYLWRIPKREDKWNQPGEKNISGKCASSVADDCSNIQRVECSSPKIAFFLKSTLTCVPAVSNSYVNMHWPLRPNRFPVCQFTFHMEHRSTKSHRQEKLHYSSVWLVEHVPSKLAKLLRFFPAPHPNSNRSEYRDPQLPERRFRFFANKGIQFIRQSRSWAKATRSLYPPIHLYIISNQWPGCSFTFWL